MSFELPEDFERIEAKYETEAPLPPSGLTPSAVFGYIHFKAFVFLQLGPERHRSIDAFQFPPAEWSEGTLETIRCGCEQIVQWRGLSPELPLEGLDIRGFRGLLQLFHFEAVLQSALALGTGEGYIIDAMQMRHVVDGREITLYNRVKLAGAEKDPGSPCPYCGQLLRTPRAKQCRACGMDWHDADNAVSRKTGSVD